MISQPGMRLLGLEPLIAIGTALPVIIPGAASGAVRYQREGLIRGPRSRRRCRWALAMAVVGSIAAEEVPGDGHLLQLATAGLLGLSSYRMGRTRRAPPAARRSRSAETDAPEAPAGAPEGSSSVLRYASIGGGRRRAVRAARASAAA